MVYLFEVISLISLVLNYMIYKRVNTNYMIGTLEELTSPVFYCCCSKVEHLEPLSEKNGEENSPPAAKVQDAYQAWTNQKEIPWVPPTSTPEPVKPLNHGPLARPDGFI